MSAKFNWKKRTTDCFIVSPFSKFSFFLFFLSRSLYFRFSKQSIDRFIDRLFFNKHCSIKKIYFFMFYSQMTIEMLHNENLKLSYICSWNWSELSIKRKYGIYELRPKSIIITPKNRKLKFSFINNLFTLHFSHSYEKKLV